jgi:hypothetical protein
LLVAAIAACSPIDPEQSNQEEPVEVFAVIAAAGASSISSDPLDRDQTCARQTMTFAVAGEWARFLDRLANQLPSDFQRRDGGEAGVVIFSRLLPGDAESIELAPELAHEGHRGRVKYAICAS